MDDATKARIAALRSTRADYQAEVEWHRFLLDAVCSTGGFKGRVGPTAVSFLGWAAEAYARDFVASSVMPQSQDKRLSYLDQFAREDDRKFSERINISHYVNYTGPLGEIFLAYVNKEPMNRDELSPALIAWMESCDGRSSGWDALMQTTVRARAALLGWCPVFFDKPRAPGGELSVAQADQLGLKLRAIPLWPRNVLDWSQDENGKLTAVKLRTDHVAREDLLKPAMRQERYAIWYIDHVVTQVIYVGVDGKETLGPAEEFGHSLGVIPLESFRASNSSDGTADDAELRGPSIVGDIATVNKRIYNLDSELDDHIRGQVFAILGVPVQDMETSISELIGGTSNGIKIPMESRQSLHYVAPPADVAGVIEKRREVLVREIYRIARIEYAKPSGVTTSGIARAYEFEQTNRRLGSIASGFAESEQRALRLVDKILGGPATTTVTPPDDFSVEDMATEIENVMSANQVDLGVTAGVEMKRRLVRRMLPNLPSETQASIEQELDDMLLQNKQDAALAQEVAQAPDGGTQASTGQPETGVQVQGLVAGNVPAQ